MKKQVILAASALALALGIPVAAHAGQDAGSFPSQICIAPGASGQNQCINNTNGDESDFNVQQFWQLGVKNNNYDITNLGNVVGENCGGSGQPACWPFVTGSGLNARYNNNLVISADWQGSHSSPTGYCLDSGQYNPYNGWGNLVIFTCLNDAHQMFVQNGYAQLVAVGASDDAWKDGQTYPAFLGIGTGGSSNGAPVLETNNNPNVRPWAFHNPA